MKCGIYGSNCKPLSAAVSVWMHNVVGCKVHFKTDAEKLWI